MTKWVLSDAEREKVCGCIRGIEYPEEEEQREAALHKLSGYVEGDERIAHGVTKAFHTMLMPLLFSIAAAEDAVQARLALCILHGLAQCSSRKHVQALLVAERFKALVSRLDDASPHVAAAAAALVTSLLKKEDSIKELFWELHLHQVVRKALANAFGALGGCCGREEEAAVAYTERLLEVVVCSTGTVLHRQELYGSGYGLCAQLLQQTSTALARLRFPFAEKLLLALCSLVRECRLNQNEFRKEPKLGALRALLTCHYTLPEAPQELRHAIELLYVFLVLENEGVARMLQDEVPSFHLRPELHSFMEVLLSGLESLRRRHYDVDVVVRSLKVIKDAVADSDSLRGEKCYFFRSCHGAWPLVFICLNNIDERIMHQACCLTAELVKDNPKNQEVLMELNGIETLSGILLDYNLDIQLVGLQVLGALRGSNVQRVGNSCIVEYLLRIISQFPSVFAQIVQHKVAMGDTFTQEPPPTVTTAANPDPYDPTNARTWEKQINIVQHALSLIGDIALHCPEVKSRVLDEKGDNGLLQLLTTCLGYLNTFYSSVRDVNDASCLERKGSAFLRAQQPRAQTAPGRLGDRGETTRTPLRVLSSFFIGVLLEVLEVLCRSLSNIVRHCREAQLKFHNNGGTETVLNCLHTIMTFTDARTGYEHEAWIKVHSTTTGEALEGISYTGEGLQPLSQDVHDDTTGSAEVGKTMYLCNNCWLVHPVLVASLVLALVNTAETNTEVQLALHVPKVRLLLHYLASHPSHVVVNSALLLVSHLCFNNVSNQRYFATPYIVQRLQTLTAVSYVQLVQGTGEPPQTLVLPWKSEHLHLLTPPHNQDPASFYAFQSLAYGLVCLAHLLQLHPAVVGALVAAIVQVGGQSVPWMQLLAQATLLPCYPIQDAALTLLSNMVNSSTEACIADPQTVDALTKLVTMDRSDDETGSACQPSIPNDREAEVKWLGNKAFQLLLNMGTPSTMHILSHVRALVNALPKYPDIAWEVPTRTSSISIDMYAGYDDVDVHNLLVTHLPILNGLMYSSDVCRKTCLDAGCWEVLTAICCCEDIELDVCLCCVYILANMISHSQLVPPDSYAGLLEGCTLDVLAQVVLLHPADVSGGDEAANMNTDFVASIFQLATQLVLRLGSQTVGGVPSRQFMVRNPETSPLLQLLQREAAVPTSPVGREALAFLLLLAEDENVAASYVTQPEVQKLLQHCTQDVSLPQTTALMVRKYWMGLDGSN